MKFKTYLDKQAKNKDMNYVRISTGKNSGYEAYKHTKAGYVVQRYVGSTGWDITGKKAKNILNKNVGNFKTVNDFDGNKQHVGKFIAKRIKAINKAKIG